MSSTQQTLDSGIEEGHEGEEQCPSCRQWYKKLGNHWSYSSEHRPSLTEKQREILIGSLLGDGNYKYQRQRFEWQDMIVRPYLKWLQERFGVLSNSVSTTPLGRSIDHLQDIGRSTTIDDLSQKFTLKTKLHPELKFCRGWGYSECGFESKFPDDLSLMPTILKIWYVGDGSLHYKNGRFLCVKITNADQTHRINYLTSLFEEIGFDVGVSSNEIRIPKPQTEQFFDYIGSPPMNRADAFAYKWEYEDHDEYKRLYNTMKTQPYWDRENECLVEDYTPEYTDY